jgi:hypothetical protein
LLRYLEARADATIDDAAMVAGCLVALGGDRHVEAALALRAAAESATGRGASSETWFRRRSGVGSGEMRRLLLPLVLLIGLSVVPSAGAAVHLRSINSPVRPGGTVTLVATAISSSPCAIRVHFGSKSPIVAAGLTSRPPYFTLLRWTWKMPVRASRGKWSVDVSCGTAGSLHTSLVVN